MTQLKTVALIIFDNDGVNVNSEDLAMRVADDFIVKMVNALSTPLAPNHIYNNYAGKSTNKIVSEVMQGRSIDPTDLMIHYGFTAENIARIKEAEKLQGDTADREAVAFAVADLITVETIERFKVDMQAVPGVTEAHKEIAEMVGRDWVFLATTSRTDRMDVTLESAVDPKTGENAGLSEVFAKGARRFSGYGTPNKYVSFLKWHTENAMPLNTSTAVVVEDSASGVQCAKVASDDFRVVGTVAARFYEDKSAQAKKLLQAGASIVIDDVHDLPNAIRWLDEGFDSEKEPKWVGKIYRANDFANASNITLEPKSP